MDESAVVTPPYVARPLRLHPFRALMLVNSRVGDPASARAFARPYRSVDERLRRWEETGRVRRDEQPAVYLHEYTAGGLTVRGLVGALDLSRRAERPEDAAVFPHEGIHPLQVAELADRMSEMGMNPAPILLVHRGPEAARTVVHRTLQRAPDHEFSDRIEQRHRIWAIRDPDDLAELDSALSGSHVLIADGHHRYAAYLRIQQSHPGTAWDRGLAMIVDQEDTPLFMGAVHRLVGGATLDDVREAADSLPDTSYQGCGQTEAVSALAPDTLVVTDGSNWGTVRIAQRPGVPTVAVETLHAELLPRMGSVTAVTYHHTVHDVMAQAARTKGLAILMPAPEFDVVTTIVDGRHLLPEKATSFQPKPSLGVLMRSLRDE